MKGDKSDKNPTYILGHSEHELNRLRAQAKFLEPVTRRFLQESGIKRGMRVLDVGSGAGDVAFLAAELVGATGEVIGADTSPTAIAAATQSAQDRGFGNVHFREGDPREMDFDGQFDAVVGRYVLPFQADPAAMLRGLARNLVKDGLMVFHEPDFTFVRSIPHAPLYDQVCRWIVDTTQMSGQSWSFLDKAYPAFVQAELPAPTMRIQTFVASAPHARDWLLAVGDIIESLLPSMERLNVATSTEVDLQTLRERIWNEVTALDCVIVGRSEVGIWTNVN